MVIAWAGRMLVFLVLKNVRVLVLACPVEVVQCPFLISLKLSFGPDIIVLNNIIKTYLIQGSRFWHGWRIFNISTNGDFYKQAGTCIGFEGTIYCYFKWFRVNLSQLRTRHQSGLRFKIKLMAVNLHSDFIDCHWKYFNPISFKNKVDSKLTWP